MMRVFSARLMRPTFSVAAALLVSLFLLAFGDHVAAQTPSNQTTTTSTSQNACPGGDGKVTVDCVITSGLRVVSDWALPLLAALAGIGVVTMALVQAAKDVFPIRRVFQRRALVSWFDTRAASGQLPTLIKLATAGNATALYDLPLTGMMGQLTTVSRIVLLSPKDYKTLLQLFAGGGGEKIDLDIQRLIAAELPPEQRGDADASPEDLERARVRVGHMIERNIDALQISLSSRWEWWNKLAAFVVSAGVTFVAIIVFTTTMSLTQYPGTWLTLAMLPVSVLAGFIAPVAKDLVTALENFRKG
jgi:hypothetical protein